MIGYKKSSFKYKNKQNEINKKYENSDIRMECANLLIQDGYATDWDESITTKEEAFKTMGQIMEINVPVVIALNMMDEVRKSGDEINAKLLEEKLGKDFTLLDL